MAFNQPKFKTEDGITKILRYEHQPIEVVEGNAVASIAIDGKVKIVDRKTSEEILTSATLIYKIGNMMKALRVPNSYPPIYSPATVENRNCSASIKADGQIEFKSVNSINNEEVELANVQVYPSLVTKLVTILRATKKATYVEFQPRD